MTDAAFSAVAVVANATLQLLRGRTQMSSPAQKPSMSFNEVRRKSQTALPGSKVRRRLYWRYILEWTKPTG
jgi:hypothetical protein